MCRSIKKPFLGCIGASLCVFVSGAAAADTLGAPIPLTVPSAITAPIPGPSPVDAAADGPVEGYGNRASLRIVLKAIIPPQVTVTVDSRIDQDQVTSWRGGPSWHHSLDAALGPLTSVASYSKNHVDISLVQEPAPKRPVGDVTSATPAAITLPPPAPVEQAWQIYANEDVDHVFRRWAEQAGVTPLPEFTATKNKDHWTISLNQEFSGNFEDALRWLSSGFSDEPFQPVGKLHPGNTLDVISVPTGARPQDVSQGRFN